MEVCACLYIFRLLGFIYAYLPAKDVIRDIARYLAYLCRAMYLLSPLTSIGLLVR